MQIRSQVLIDGARNFVIRLNAVGDGTGVQLTNVKVVDVSAMTPPAGASFKLHHLGFRVLGGVVQLSWDAPAPVIFAELQLADSLDWRQFGGQSTRGVSGATGSVLLSTLGFDVGSSFDLTLRGWKNTAG